ncbi:MAG TPA: phage portal protein, partial [Candidatus Limnocylindrales bacterium]|nr:phage portal protein [Candidatus Limnocylindrales bacterium]
MAIFAQPLGEARGWRLQVSNPRSPAYWVQKLFGGGIETASGKRVTPDVAMTMSAVFASVRILSEDIGTLPFGVYQKTATGRQEEPNHPVEFLMARKANPEMTGIDFRQTIQGHAALRGNGYAEKQYDQGGRPIALWPLRPDQMQVGRNGQNGVSIAAAKPGELLYLYRLPNGEIKVFSRDQIFHLKGISGDGLVGYSPVAMAREAIGLGLATEEFGSRFFANDARPGVALKAPGQLSDRTLENLEKSWADRHQGLNNAQRVAILEEGLDI